LLSGVAAKIEFGHSWTFQIQPTLTPKSRAIPASPEA
jgi:hypothetical protein